MCGQRRKKIRRQFRINKTEILLWFKAFYVFFPNAAAFIMQSKKEKNHIISLEAHLAAGGAAEKSDLQE